MDDREHSHQDTPRRRGSATGIRLRFLILLFVPATAAILGVAYLRADRQLKAERERLAAELLAAEQEHEETLNYERQERQSQLRAEEAEHRTRLTNKKLVSGEAAQLAHAAEWKRRLAQDPALAASTLETTMLKMRRVGLDTELAAGDALQQVAQLASPAGSRVEVAPLGSGFNVRVAFKLSAVAADESGGTTRHHTVASLRREIETVSARLIRQLFDFCGSRGIQKMSVSCNRAVQESPVPEGATAAERDALVSSSELVMRSLYRLSIPGAVGSQVHDWRALSESTVLQMATVEKDGLVNFKITTSGRSWMLLEDPKMPLEF